MLYGGLINAGDKQLRRKRPTPKGRHPHTQYIAPRGLRLSFSETPTHVASEAAGRQVRHRIGSVSRDAEIARKFGAEGIGLCRTEHMFLGERLPIVQRFILAADAAEERAALEELAKLLESPLS